MRDIARQREEIFRAIGEGTGLSMDTDIYDKTYYQLIIWSIPNDDFVGAERIGIGHELVDKDGIQGFYSASEFEYQKGSEPLLSTCMEIGRTFISRNYQREVLPMKIFFASTSVIALKFPRIKYLMGPVTISDAMPDFYKSLIEHYITHEFPYENAEAFSRPPVPFKADFLAVNPDALLVKTYGNLDEFDRLLSTLSDGKVRLPVLMKRYFKYSARSVCFNVDPLFNNCLDCLILLRLADYPKDTLEMLLKSIPEDMHEPIRKALYGEE
ncbi:MAG: GNAT family N-acetyltransferase [Bacteroidota bacterium]|nr:GNAT family N-acetyltransferase [Bacteroidota bacterium]